MKNLPGARLEATPNLKHELTAIVPESMT